MNKNIDINNFIINSESHTFIIAEMSANHLQNLDRAKRIVLEAKKAGADAIKLQTFRPDTITIDCYGEEFMATKGSAWEGKNLFELYETAYLPWEWHREIFEYAKEVGIICFSSPFDLTAIDLLEELGCPAYKIASYEIVDIPLIRKAARTGKPIILSTGIATLEDIERAINACKEEGNEDVVILKCVSQYPTPFDSLNLKTIPNMAETFDCIVGLSDHSMGDAVAVASVVLGGKVIEKHLTLKRADGGPDCFFSMEPEEFKIMVDNIRNIEMAIGKCTYELTEYQKKCKKNSRSIYVVEDVKAGDIITEENIKSVRPGYGIKPMYYEEVLGKKFCTDLKKGSALKWEYIE